MAYIDRTKLLTDIDNGIKAGNLEEGYEQYQNINNMDDIIEAIEWSDEAEVIERSEYEELRLVNLDLAETNKGLLAEHEQLEKLRSKVNKAIEEIEERIKYSKLPTVNRYNTYSEGLGDCLDILKRNIGR